jgi:hypothetical protein
VTRALLVAALALVTLPAHATTTSLMVIQPVVACGSVEEGQQCTPETIQSGAILLYDDTDALNKLEAGTVVQMWWHTCERCAPSATVVYVTKKDWNPQHFRRVK